MRSSHILYFTPTCAHRSPKRTNPKRSEPSYLYFPPLVVGSCAGTFNASCVRARCSVSAPQDARASALVLAIGGEFS